MALEIRKTWFGRYRVYEIGQIDGDDVWLATFRHEWAAIRFCEGQQ